MFESLEDIPQTYNEFLDRYKDLPANDKMKSALTDIAFSLAQKVWLDLQTEFRGTCFFCIGGVNQINPFSAKAVKNEIVVYAEAVRSDALYIFPEEGAFYAMDGRRMSTLDLSHYDEIYMDFNGSMAHLTESWQKRLSDPAVASKVMCLLVERSLIAYLIHWFCGGGFACADPGGICDGGRLRRCCSENNAVD